MSALRPPSLPELQSRLQDVLSDPGGVDAATARSAAHAQVLPWILDGAGADARTRLSVYSDAYFLRLLDSLGHDFPALKRALGGDGFRGLIADYLKKNPSTFKSVSMVGGRLFIFVRRHSLSQKFGFLPDLARLEWAVLSCLYRDRLKTAGFFRSGALPEADMPSVELSLGPAARLLETDWAVDRLWHREELPGDRGPRRLRKKEPRKLLIFRDESWVRVESLDPARWSALKKIERGATLGSVCRHWENSSGFRVAPAAARKWFKNWIQSGIVAIRRPS
ncbi:MAG: HvfC/BufC family peptide modification chaperone [Elusimicrobiota bacterium]